MTLFLLKGSWGPPKKAGGSIAFGLIKIMKDKGADLGNGKGHVWRQKMMFWKLKFFEKWEEK